MPLQPAVVPAAPPVPDRSDRTNFTAQMYAFHVWEHDSEQPGMTALAAVTYSNALEAAAQATAKALTSFKGVYAGGTTYAQGDSVYVAGSGFYISNINANTGNAPATSPTQWAPLSYPQRSGAASNGTTSVTLVVGSAVVQKFAPTAPGQYVKLPDATLISALLAPYFVFHNSGSCDLRVQDSAGVTRGFVPAGAAAEVSLTDNSTAAGGWAITNGALFGITASLEQPGGGYSTTLNQFSSLPLDSARTLLMWLAGASLYGVAYDSSQAIGSQWGAPTLLSNAPSTAFFKPVLLSANVPVIFYGTSSGASRMTALPLSISGTAITPGTAANATAATAPTRISDAVVQGTGAFVTFTVGAVLNLAGVTVTANVAAWGPIVTLAASGSTSVATSDLYISGSTLVAIYHNATASTLAATPYTASGATLTPGTGATNASFVDAWGAMKTIATAGGWVAVNDDLTAGIRAAYITLSGSVITMNTALVHSTLLLSSAPTRHDLLAANGKLVWMYSDGTSAVVTAVLTFSGATISNNDQQTFQWFTGAAAPVLVPPTSGNVVRAVLAGTNGIRVYAIDVSATTAVVTQRHLYGGQDLSTPGQNKAKAKRDPKTMLSSNNVAAAIPIWVSGAYNKRNTALAMSPSREWQFIQDVPECGSFADSGNTTAESWLMSDTAAAQANGGLYLQRIEMAQP